MNAHLPSIEAKRSREWDTALPRKLSAAVQEFDFSRSSASKSIRELGFDFEIDGFLVDAESTTIDGQEWVAPGTIFLLINYKTEDGSPDYLNESFPILVKFIVGDESINIKDIDADVSSFDR